MSIEHVLAVAPVALAELAERGLPSSAPEPVSKGVQLAPMTDPEGNRITFIGNFRVRY